jgi:GNAT superfamily N-acetyltransferase
VAGWTRIDEAFLPESLRASAADVLAKHNLYPAMNLTGMAADRLLDPVRPLPQLEYRRVDDMDGFREVMDVNSYAYDFPLELGRGSLGTDASGWREHPWAYMAMVDGKPVATTATFNLDGCRYVGLVATLPDTQRRGFAEAVMRKSLEECAKDTGLTRTVLHATDAGRPVTSNVAAGAPTRTPISLDNYTQWTTTVGVGLAFR